jgi:hypothetical protein
MSIPPAGLNQERCTGEIITQGAYAADSDRAAIPLLNSAATIVG